jgi:type I restriction enzyme S subunit
MKKGWEIKRLDDVVEFQRGLTYSKKDEVEFSENIVLRSNNVDLFRNQLNFSELKYINSSIEIPENKKVKKGSLLICTANGSKSHLGKVALIDDDYNYAFGGFMGLINPKQKLNSKFLFYLMTSDNYKKFINELSDGANINNLKFGDLGQFEIPIPPLAEQQRIVSILDECFAAIDKAKANAEQNLKNAKELFESYLQGVFGGFAGSPTKRDGWEEKRLGDVVDNIMTGPFGSMLHKSDYVDNGIPVVNPQNIVNGKILPLEKTMINQTTFKRLEKYALKRGDIVIARRGEMGRCAVVKEENVNWLCGTGSFVIRTNPRKSDSDFLNVILGSDFVKKRLEKHSVGATMNNLNQSILYDLTINIPPLHEQQSIVKKLDALRAETQKLEAVYQKKIEDLEELKRSILQRAFAGELRTGELIDSVS